MRHKSFMNHDAMPTAIETILEPQMNKSVSAKLMILRTFLAVVAILGLQNLSAYAQVSTGDIVGTVADLSGAVVPGAKVILTNTGTQVQSNTVSNATGDFLLTYLQPGNYSLRIEASGFQAFAVANIVLSAGDRIRENAMLQIGASTQTVEVTQESPIMQRESSTVGTVVTEQQIEDLPLNARNFFNLIQLQPGVTAGSPDAISSGQRPDDRRAPSTISANGQADFYNNNLLDGIDNNEILQGVVALRPSVDALQEITVDTSNFSAEVGRDAGAVVNLVTKSGSNALHGSAYEFFRNDIFDAREFFATEGVVPKPEYRQNQFGGSIGGPILKNKTFFFADLEDSRVIQGQSTGDLTVPTLFEEQNPGNFSDIGGPVVPVLSASGLAYFDMFPAPDVPGAGPVNNYTNVIKTSAYTLTGDARIDHHFNNGDTLYGRYSYNKTNTNIPGAFPAVTEDGLTFQPNGNLFAYSGTSNQSAQGALFNYTHLFTQNLLMELKAGYTRINFDSENLNSNQDVSTAIGVTNGNIPGLPGTTGLTPTLFLTGGYADLGDSPYLPIINVQNSFQYQGSLTYTHGRHNFKFGGELIRRQLNYFQSSIPLGALVYYGITGNPLADMLVGYNLGYERGNTLVRQGFRRWEPGGYAQDQWRVTPNFTLNFGVRYDVYTPFTEVHNRYANFDYPALTLITGSQDPDVGIHTDYKNIAPRVGFAYSVAPHTVLRGGYGISYYPTEIAVSILLANPPTAYQSTCLALSCIGMPLPYPTAPSTTDLSGNLSYAANNLNASMQQMWNLTMQQEVGNNVATLAYVGEVGRNLLFVTPQANAPYPNGPYPDDATDGPGLPPTLTTAAAYPNVGLVEGFTPQAVSNYNALQASFARRFGHGLAFNANYTWAHGLTDAYSSTGENLSGQGLLASDPRYDYGNAGNDVRNRFALTATYAAPFGASATGVRGVLEKGWATDLISFWQTGLPFTVVSNATNPYGLAQINLPDVSTDRPNVTGATTVLANPSHTEFFNTSAFTPQPAGTPGNEAFNQLYGPHQRRTDLSIFKNFNTGGHGSLQFRAECFNISNTPNFSMSASGYTITSYNPGPAHGPNNPISKVGPLPGDVPVNATNSTTGQPSAFGTLSQVTPGLNPRQFQFALKYLF